MKYADINRRFTEIVASRQSRAKKKTHHMTLLPCEGFVRVFR